VQLGNGYPHRRPACRDQRERSVEPFGDLAQRAAPMPAVLIRQIVCLPDRADRVREGGLEKLGIVGHWDHSSWDADGWGWRSMYSRAI
jgi:hypothetical protein